MEQDPVTFLIPWYANRTLSTDEKALVDRHLPSCSGCRALLSAATEHAALFADAMRRDGHVHPALLVRYAEDPSSLDEETLAGIEARLSHCDACADALTLVRGTERPEAARPERRGILDFLRSTILAPAPALAYLLVLALLVPLLLRRGAGPEPARVSGVPTVVRVEGERATRSGGEAAPVEPLRIEPPERADEPLLLLLDTELAVEDLLDPKLSFAVEVTRAGSGSVTESRRGSDLIQDGGRIVLPLVITVRPGEELSLAIRAKKPGDAIDGRVLYRRRVAIGAGR